MKVALAFLPKVRLNKNQAYYVLKLRLFSFFLFIYFICISFLFYLLFLLKRFIVLKDSISPVLTLKRTFICGFTCTKNACEVKGFWVLGLQAAELYSNLHFTGICMLNGKQLSCSILLAFLSQS